MKPRSDFTLEMFNEADVSPPGLPDRHDRPVILPKGRFSPNLCTPCFQYGSRNSIVSGYLELQRNWVRKYFWIGESLRFPN